VSGPEACSTRGAQPERWSGEHRSVDRFCEHDEGCITCGDTALPLTVLRVDEGRGLALCANEAGQRETVEIALVGPVDPGDSLLVHAGTAIARAA
jgi:HupF/HypC family